MSNSDATDTTDADAGGAVELALRLIPPEAWQMVFALVKIAVDPRTTKRNLRSLHDALAAVTEGQAKLAADRAEHDVQVAKDRAELDEASAAARKRQIAVAQAEAALEEREQRYVELERAWAGLKLPGDTFSTFGGLSRQEPYSALQKAKFATEHGRLPAIDEPIEGPVDEDPQGGKFPAHTTLTRTPEPRVRPSRSGAA